MTATNGSAGQPPTPLRTVHVTNGTHTSISTDGTTCLMKFTCADGQELGLTFPAKGLGAMRTMWANLMRDVARHDAGATGVPIRRLQSIAVQRHDGVRGNVLVVIDGNLPEETAFALPDGVAVQIGTQMRQLALDGLSPEDRIRAQVGPKPSIIIPGR